MMNRNSLIRSHLGLNMEQPFYRDIVVFNYGQSTFKCFKLCDVLLDTMKLYYLEINTTPLKDNHN